MKIHSEVDPAPLRAAAYMEIGDQLDALMKGFAALMDKGIELPAETLLWVEHCQAVKDRYKKGGSNG
jgi:hypothetical protein